MGLFTKNSRVEAKARANWLSSKHSEADEALQSYRKGKTDTETVRRELARHDSYFRYAEDQDLKDL